MTAAHTDHLKLRILTLLLGMLSSGLVFAEESGAFSSRTSATTEVGFNLDYGNHQMVEYAIDERIVDRLGLFDPSDLSTRYSVSLDLENEDSDWSFEATVTVEF